MTNDDYVIDDNGAWGNPSLALQWYRKALAAEKERADYAWRNTNTIEKDRQALMAERDALRSGIAAENEACAQLCEEEVTYPAGHGGQWEGYGPVKTTRSGKECATAIRRRRMVAALAKLDLKDVLVDGGRY